MHFIYYINGSVATKVDSTYLGYWPAAHGIYVLWREVGANSWRLDDRVRRFPSTPHIANIDFNENQNLQFEFRHKRVDFHIPK